MMYTQENKYHIVVLKRGEKIIESVTKFCKEQHIEGGFFTGLGAVEEPTLAHYSVPTKTYSKQTLHGVFELTNITGSIGIANELIIHAHVTLSDDAMKAFGGHLVEATVSGTLELIVFQTKKLVKKLDEETGLKLFRFS